MWLTERKLQIPIYSMDTAHIENAIAMLIRKMFNEAPHPWEGMVPKTAYDRKVLASVARLHNAQQLQQRIVIGWLKAELEWREQEARRNCFENKG